MPRSDVGQTLQNVLLILRRIQSGHPIDKRELARELDRSERQIRRYLTTLSEAGFHIETDEQGRFRGRVRLLPYHDQETPLELLTLSRREMILLYLQLSGIGQVGSPRMRMEVMTRIRNAMGGEEIDFAELTEMLITHERAYKSYDSPRSKQTIAALLEALYWDRVCDVTYRIPNEEFDRVYEAEPYRIMEFDGGLYCYCHLPETGLTRLLAVERIREISLREQYFEHAAEVEQAIEQHTTNAFRLIDDGETIRVRLRFTPDQKPYVLERVWHPSQEIEQHDDGSATLSFESTGRFEIIRWILGWGPACEVIEPDTLRDEIKTVLKQASEQYG